MRYDCLEQLDALSDDDLLELRKRIDATLATRGSPSIRQPLCATPASACRFFTVSHGVRRLDRTQLAALTKSFEEWVDRSRDFRTRRSRERVLIIFLVLRYTGARLGEVLALDEHKDIDVSQSIVHIRDGSGYGADREVPVPRDVAERIQSWCEETSDHLSPERGPESLFNLDQGFLRRKFYEQEARCHLSRDLLNPRVLRNSRAIELLQGGMPMRAVQALLGHSKTDFTAAYVTLSEDDLRTIIRQHCTMEFGMETSARNTFRGNVAEITSNTVTSEIVLRTDSDYEIEALITNRSRTRLGLKKGNPVLAMVKATWVKVEKPEAPMIVNARNAFWGTITEVLNDGSNAEVQGLLEDETPVCALLSGEKLRELGVGQGDTVLFTFKAISVILS